MEAVQRVYTEKKDKFTRFFELLSQYNAKFNLTSITEEKDVLYKHFYDSLAGMDLFPKGIEVAEVGSGGGFPSIPLMFAREDLSFTLIESKSKKCDFLKVVVREFGLKATVLCSRAEEVSRSNFREYFDASTARAVASLPVLAEYCLPLVKPGGLLVAYKGPTEKGRSAIRAFSQLGGELEDEAEYSLPEGIGTRTLIVVRKVDHTPPKYPRGKGEERRTPLS